MKIYQIKGVETHIDGAGEWTEIVSEDVEKIVERITKLLSNDEFTRDGMYSTYYYDLIEWESAKYIDRFRFYCDNKQDGFYFLDQLCMK